MLAVIALFLVSTSVFATNSLISSSSIKNQSRTDTHSSNENDKSHSEKRDNDKTQDTDDDRDTLKAEGTDQKISPPNTDDLKLRKNDTEPQTTKTNQQRPPDSTTTAPPAAPPSRPDYNLNSNVHSAVVNGMRCTIPAVQVTEVNEAEYCTPIAGNCGRFFGIGSTGDAASAAATSNATNSLPPGTYFLPKCGAGGLLDEDECSRLGLSCGRW